MIVIHPGYPKQKSILILIEWVYNLIAFILIMQSDTILTLSLFLMVKRFIVHVFFTNIVKLYLSLKLLEKNDRKKTSIIFQF